MADLSDPNQLSSVLSMLSANDTAMIKKGEKILKPFLKNSQCVLHLINMLGHSPDVSIRHHAALLLKKKVGKFYKKFDKVQQEQLKEHMLALMTGEASKPVAVAIAGAAAVLAKHCFECGGAWPEVFNLITRLAQDPNERLRVLNYQFLAQLSETVSDHLKAHTETLAQMFIAGCQDAVSSVSMAALAATSSYITALGSTPEVMGLQGVLNPMIHVMSVCMQNGDDDTVVEALEVIQECCELEQPLVNDHIQVITEFVMRLICTEDAEVPVKQSAGQTLMNIIEFRPKLFAKCGLVAPTLLAMMEMIAKQEASAAGALFSYTQDGVLDENKPSGSGAGGDDDDDDDDGDYTPEMDVKRNAQVIVDTMAIHLPSKHFVEPALTLCAQGMASADPQMRKAGCAMLGVIAEGCCDRIREKLSDILPSLLGAVQDSEYYVRECACFALGQFSEYCQPEILSYTSTVLPTIFQALDDNRPTVRGTSCYVLEMFCENLEATVLRPFLSPLMTKLVMLLDAPERTTKEMALSAIAATAVASEIEFLPFAEATCNILGPMLFLTEPAQYPVRGRALECFGHIAVAIGPDHFSRYFETGMQSATQATSLNDESLKEHTYVFIANTAKVMGKRLSSYMPTMVPFLIDIVAESELTLFSNTEPDSDEEVDVAAVIARAQGPGGLAGAMAEATAAAGVNGQEEEEDDDDDYRLNVHEGFVNSKKSAITALGSLAEHTEELFAPYMTKCLEVLLTEGIGATSSFHPSIRAEAFCVLQQMLKSCCRSNGIMQPANIAGREILNLNSAVMEMGSIIIGHYLRCMASDTDKDPVAQSCEGLNEVLKLLGLAALQLPAYEAEGACLPGILTVAVQLLGEKTPCQKKSKYAGDDEDDEEDHDHVLIDAVTDLVGVLATLMHEGFLTFFDEFAKPLFKFTKPARSISDRSMAIGCFGEVLAEVGPGALKYVEPLMPILRTGLVDPMESVRRNSAFCVAMMVKSCQQALVPQYMPILQMLHPLCVRSNNISTISSSGADVDNALTAVAYMISTSKDSVPLAQVLPVMLSSLPLKGDITEGPNIYQCLGALLLMGDAVAMSSLPQLLTCFAEVLTPDAKAIEQTKTIVSTCLKEVAGSTNHREALLAAMGQLDPAMQAVLQNAMAH